MEVFAVIIAGGVGARFWPKSRGRMPKQLLEIIGQGSMIQNTVLRLQPVVPAERVLIITNAEQEAEIRRQIPAVPAANILVEPVGKNTAPAIMLGAEVLKKRAGDRVMIVLPADHLIRDVPAFHDTLRRAVSVAEKSKGLVTLGVRPTAPETGYGYIQYDETATDNPYAKDGAFPVRTFAEKPNLPTAMRFIESGDFLWNSGMFIWKCSAIKNAIAEQLPDLFEEFQRIRHLVDTDEYPRALEGAYKEMPSISIDYGVMEKAGHRYIIPVEFGWSDLGSWDEVYRLSEKDESGNAVKGTVFVEDVKNCQIVSDPSMAVAAIGVQDLIIIQTGDALLVCRRGKSQQVKNVVDFLRKNELEDYL